MSIIRTTTIICLTVLICVALFIFYGSVENRYKLIKGDNGLYIFDNNSSVTNYCNSTNCKGISAGMIFPHRQEIGRIPGVPMKSEQPQKGNVAMTYLPIQGNQAYILQPIPQGMQPGMSHQPMPMQQPAPQPMPTMMPQAPAPVPAPVPVVTPAPVFAAPQALAPMASAPVEMPPVPAPVPGGAEFDEDMGFTLPEPAPSAPESFSGLEGGQEADIPNGGLPGDQDAGGFEAVP